jgi:hypothetical protein
MPEADHVEIDVLFGFAVETGDGKSARKARLT